MHGRIPLATGDLEQRLLEEFRYSLCSRPAISTGPGGEMDARVGRTNRLSMFSQHQVPREEAESNPFLEQMSVLQKYQRLEACKVIVPLPLTMSNSSLCCVADFLSRKCCAIRDTIMGRCHSSRTRRSKAVGGRFLSPLPCGCSSPPTAGAVPGWWMSVRCERSSLARTELCQFPS